MNKERRKAVRDVMDQLQGMLQLVESIEQDERDAFENLPEGLQGAERGAAMEAAADNLSYARDSIEEAINYLEESVE